MESAFPNRTTRPLIFKSPPHFTLPLDSGMPPLGAGAYTGVMTADVQAYDWTDIDADSAGGRAWPTKVAFRVDLAIGGHIEAVAWLSRDDHEYPVRGAWKWGFTWGAVGARMPVVVHFARGRMNGQPCLKLVRMENAVETDAQAGAGQG